MILEAVVTTLQEDGSVHVAPMGPEVGGASFDQFCLRPYTTSQTLAHLRRWPEGVLHVTDDVELLARAAVGRLQPLPATMEASCVRGAILKDACRWLEFRVEALDESAPRARVTCQVVATGRGRDFFGFCRAKHAVVEAAILATRTDFLPQGEILQEMRRLQQIVDKTAGPQEERAFQFLQEYVRELYADQGNE